MLIDAHVHLFSRRFYQFWANEARVPLEKVGELTNAQVPDSDDTSLLAERWIKELDKHNVDRAVLISSVTGDGGALGKILHTHGHRFSGYFFLDPTQPDAMQRLRRGVEDAGLRGACLFPALHHYFVDDERLHPLFGALDRVGAVAFVHTGLLQIPIQKKLGMHPTPDLKYSNPINLHSVCNAFPNLNFVIPHFGAGYLHETLMLGILSKNVFVDTSSSNDWMRLFPGLTLETVFQQALDIFGAERIIFGTDSSSFPRGWREDIFQRQKQTLEKIGLAKPEQAKIFGENIARLLKV